VVDKDGKETEYNVPWDEKHFDTSGLVSGAKPVPKAAKTTSGKSRAGFVALPNTPPQVGEIIIFVLPVVRGHRSPFGVGRILSVTNGKDIEFQWLGNHFYDYEEPFHNGWMNLSEDLGYYTGGKKLQASDVAWTGSMTGTKMSTDLVFARGNDLLTKARLLSAKAKKAIVEELGPVCDWPKEPKA